MRLSLVILKYPPNLGGFKNCERSIPLTLSNAGGFAVIVRTRAGGGGEAGWIEKRWVGWAQFPLIFCEATREGSLTLGRGVGGGQFPLLYCESTRVFLEEKRTFTFRSKNDFIRISSTFIVAEGQHICGWYAPVPSGRRVTSGRRVPSGRRLPSGRRVPSGRRLPSGRRVTSIGVSRAGSVSREGGVSQAGGASRADGVYRAGDVS